MTIVPPIRQATGRAAVFIGVGQPLALRDIPLPQLETEEALVRIECCTICGSDLHTLSGAREEPTPSILGHEIMGVVAEVGSPPPYDLNGNELKPGDRVTWAVFVSCGNCVRCQGGLPQKCLQLAKYGHELAEGRGALSGGLSEWILLRRGSSIVKLESDLPAKLICPVSCATATIAAAYRVGEEIQNRSILILGAGMLGLTATAFAKTNGASKIVVCDVAPNRLLQAQKFGADVTLEWPDDFESLKNNLRADTGTDSFDLVLELSGSPDAVEAACRFGDIGANIVLVGSVKKSRPVELDPEQIVRKWLSIRGVHNYAPEDLQTAVSFLKSFGDQFPFEELVQHTFPLSKINEAIEFAMRDRPIRVAIRP